MGIRFPKNSQKRIYWDKNVGTAVILVGYCPDTLGYFRAMAREAKKSFPDLNDEDIICSKVRGSNVHGYTVIMFKITGKRRNVHGWNNRGGEIDFDY